jgi:hypothetical protein
MTQVWKTKAVVLHLVAYPDVSLAVASSANILELVENFETNSYWSRWLGRF